MNDTQIRAFVRQLIIEAKKAKAAKKPAKKADKRNTNQ